MLVTFHINFSWFILSNNYCSFMQIMQSKFRWRACRCTQVLKGSIKYAILVDCYGNKWEITLVLPSYINSNNMMLYMSNPYYPSYVFSLFASYGSRMQLTNWVFYLAYLRTSTLTRKMYVYIDVSYICFYVLCPFIYFFLVHNLACTSSYLPVLFSSHYLLNAFSAMQGNCSILTLNVRGLIEAS